MSRGQEGTYETLVERPLCPGEIRFVPKPHRVARGRSAEVVWEVYDRARGSFPMHVPGFGPVRQALASWGDARAEADRLAGFYGVPTGSAEDLVDALVEPVGARS